MRQHWSPEAEPSRSRSRRRTRIILAGSVGVVLVGSGLYIANANAAETTVPGRVQAESFAAQSGAQTENTADADGGKNVGWLASGDWLRFDNVDLGAAGPLTLTARVASDSTTGGSVELHTGTQTGALLATLPVTRTGGWQKWETKTATAATHPAGKQTVFAVMKSSAKSDFVNLNWFTFGGGTVVGDPTAAPTTAPTSAPSSSAPATTAPTAGTPTGDGWVTIDKAKWDKQLAAYNALKAAPLPAGKVHDVSEFNASCTTSHKKADDPIVFPGIAGASHMHTFLGNKSTNAASTNEGLMLQTDSSCKPAADHSAYWVPTLYDGANAVDPDGVTVYYGSNLTGDRSKVVPFPEGFRMITGDAKRQVPTSSYGGNKFWCPGDSGQKNMSADGNWPICQADKAHYGFHLSFEECWDGVHLDSPDHKSHVGPRDQAGNCSGKFPVAIPSLGFEMSYPTKGSNNMKLSSGLQSSMHGDFMNAWEPDALAARVKNCLTQTVKCNTEGQY